MLCFIIFILLLIRDIVNEQVLKIVTIPDLSLTPYEAHFEFPNTYYDLRFQATVEDNPTNSRYLCNVDYHVNQVGRHICVNYDDGVRWGKHWSFFHDFKDPNKTTHHLKESDVSIIGTKGKYGDYFQIQGGVNTSQENWVDMHIDCRIRKTHCPEKREIDDAKAERLFFIDPKWDDFYACWETDYNFPKERNCSFHLTMNLDGETIEPGTTEKVKGTFRQLDSQGNVKIIDKTFIVDENGVEYDDRLATNSKDNLIEFKAQTKNYVKVFFELGCYRD